MSVAGVFATAALVSFAAPSYAALVSCPASFTTSPTAKVEDGTGTLTAVNACQYISPPDNNNVANLDNINDAEFFGFDDWESNAQMQMEGAGNVGNSGTWAIANVDFAAFDYMIVFKDGANTNLVAFLFNELFASGVWSTPFTDPPFSLPGNSTAAGNSHLTIVRREGGGGGEEQVSEPSVLALLGLSLLMLGFVRRRKAIA
jgi:PEP-CTERM motif